MVIQEWSENIHEPQEGEVAREWCYLHPYMFFNGSLHDYSLLLDYAFKKQHTEDQPKTNRNYDKFLSQHPIEFHEYDIKKGHAPTENQLENWSKGQNCKCDIKYTWNERKMSNRKNIAQSTNENMAAIYVEFLPQAMASFIKGFEDTDYVVEFEKNEDKFTSTKAKDAATARSTDFNSMRIAAGMEDTKNIKMTAELDANANIETTSEVNIDYEKLHERDKALMQELMGVDNDNNSSSSE